MSVSFIYDVSGSMYENRSLIFYYFHTLTNVKESYNLQFEQFLWADEIRSFYESKDLSFGVKVNVALLSKTIPDQDTLVLITDGCFSDEEKHLLSKEAEKRKIIYLLVGENSNYQLVKKIAKDHVYRIEDMFSCLNYVFPGVFL